MQEMVSLITRISFFNPSARRTNLVDWVAKLSLEMLTHLKKVWVKKGTQVLTPPPTTQKLKNKRVTSSASCAGIFGNTKLLLNYMMSYCIFDYIIFDCIFDNIICDCIFVYIICDCIFDYNICDCIFDYIMCDWIYDHIICNCNWNWIICHCLFGYTGKTSSNNK